MYVYVANMADCLNQMKRCVPLPPQVISLLLHPFCNFCKSHTAAAVSNYITLVWWNAVCTMALNNNPLCTKFAYWIEKITMCESKLTNLQVPQIHPHSYMYIDTACWPVSCTVLRYVALLLITIIPYLTGFIPYLTGFIPYLTGFMPYLAGFTSYLTGSVSYVTGFTPYSTGSTPYLTRFIPYLTGFIT